MPVDSAPTRVSSTFFPVPSDPAPSGGPEPTATSAAALTGDTITRSLGTPIVRGTGLQQIVASRGLAGAYLAPAPQAEATPLRKGDGIAHAGVSTPTRPEPAKNCGTFYGLGSPQAWAAGAATALAAKATGVGRAAAGIGSAVGEAVVRYTFPRFGLGIGATIGAELGPGDAITAVGGELGGKALADAFAPAAGEIAGESLGFTAEWGTGMAVGALTLAAQGCSPS